MITELELLSGQAGLEHGSWCDQDGLPMKSSCQLMTINDLVIDFWLQTYLSSRALVIQRAKRNGWQQDSDVEEDGRGGVFQQRSVRAQNTWIETTQQQTPQPEQQRVLLFLVKVKSSTALGKMRLAICEVGQVQWKPAAQVFINTTTCSEEIFYLGIKGDLEEKNMLINVFFNV